MKMQWVFLWITINHTYVSVGIELTALFEKSYPITGKLMNFVSIYNRLMKGVI